ncbi:MAG: S8 family serine peptidase, partial [Pyrinomonadaceae bacterium]
MPAQQWKQNRAFVLAHRKKKRVVNPKMVSFGKTQFQLATYILCLMQAFPGAIPRNAPSLATTSTGERMIEARGKLLKQDRLRLVEAQGEGKRDVTLLIASKIGANEAVAAEISKLGGLVQYRDDDVSYLRARVPTSNVEELSYRKDIDALNINGVIDYLTYADSETTTFNNHQHQQSGPDKNTPRENPYLPSREMRAPQFIAQHPRFDGRGVAVAIIDSSIDMLLPEFQTATQLDGRIAPKLADVLTAVPSAIASNESDSSITGYFKVNMEEMVVAVDGRFTSRGRSYIAPTSGNYRLGTFDERINNPSDDLNRDGNPAGSSGLFSVLWDDMTNTVWVDSNQDSNFAAEKPMTDYCVRQDVGTFGKDNPQTAVRETVGFTLQTDARHKLILVIPGYGSHGTGVAGVAVGKDLLGGKLSGVAPEAQIVSVPLGRGATNVTPSCIESVVVAMKNPKVDLVSIQFGNFHHQNDGQSTFALICDRLIDKYQKLIFAGAGNGTDWLNNILSPADANNVIAVGSYITRQTSWVNYGVEVSRQDNVDAFSSHGPSKQGGFKPNLVAPTTSLTTRPGFLTGQNRQGTYSLPPGYQISGGTSIATPMAAGAAALLISAAK